MDDAFVSARGHGDQCWLAEGQIWAAPLAILVQEKKNCKIDRMARLDAKINCLARLDSKKIDFFSSKLAMYVFRVVFVSGGYPTQASFQG